MLSPNTRIVLLPQDRQIMDITGMSEEQYRWFVRQAIFESKLRPGEPTAFLETIVVSLVVGLLLTAASTLLTPKPRQQSSAELEVKDVQGQTLVNGARYTPKTGFDSVQNVVELGSTIPLVYANRQSIDGINYGGVRVNTNLLWSQIYSIGGGQLLRAVFLVGEADVDTLDPTQFAIGNNLISGYDLERRDAGRICLYYSKDGGRLKSSDYIAGVEPGEDVGNAENDGGGDVFQVRGPDNNWTNDFCYVSTPNNQTTFGLYGFIGNNMPFRINPVFRPAVIVENRVSGGGGDSTPETRINCKGDDQQRAQRKKQDVQFAGRVGVTKGGGLNVGDTVELTLNSSTDAKRTFRAGGGDGEVECNDVGQAVSSRQRSVDEQINYGDLYRIGSALGICVTRTPEAFISDADNDPIGGGRSVSAVFEIIRPGAVSEYSLATIIGDGGLSATASSHVMRAAEANISTEREGKVVELGFRSQMQINISGLCNFKDGRGYDKIDQDACFANDGDLIEKSTIINFTSGTYSTYETRYSFFRVAYRVAGSGDDYTEIQQLFGVRSTTGVAVYNYIRFGFDTAERWDIRITPISGWEVRSGVQSGDLVVLDPHLDSVSSVSSGAVTVWYTGEIVSRSQNIFCIESLNASEITGGSLNNGNFQPDDGDYIADAWARLAEGFMYNEIQATTTQPEHAVVYCNVVSENISNGAKFAPKYDDMAIVGMNIRSSKEISSLNQFSVYVNQGINSTSKFPDVLYDLLTNDRYGTGQVMSPAQIDKQSFDAAADWAVNRRYFFDGAISERVNIRSWGAEIASSFLLDFLMRNGKFALQPVANFDGPETITGIFTVKNIIDDSFEMSYSDAQDRIPPRIAVVWRQEREDSTATPSKGLFPVLREVTVREADTPEDAPLEKIDLSDFCTSEIQAIDRAKWECRVRRLVTHSVTFKTTPLEASLDLGAVFQLEVETVTYSQPQNGAVGNDGVVTAWPALEDGEYPVLLWDGTGNAIQETTLRIEGGKALDRVNSVFSVKRSIFDSQTYKTQSLSYDEEGNIDVTALYFPTDRSNNSLLTQGWDSGWVIEGQA